MKSCHFPAYDRFVIYKTKNVFLLFKAVAEEVYHNVKQKMLFSNESEFWTKTKELKSIWVSLSLILDRFG